jgi:hypothetical protein
MSNKLQVQTNKGAKLGVFFEIAYNNYKKSFRKLPETPHLEKEP